MLITRVIETATVPGILSRFARRSSRTLAENSYRHFPFKGRTIGIIVSSGKIVKNLQSTSAT